MGILLKNPLNLMEKQLETWDQPKDGNLRTFKAPLPRVPGHLGLHARASTASLGRWLKLGLRSCAAAMVKAVQTVRQFVSGILRVPSSDRTTAVTEGIKSLVQAAKACRRDYRNVDNFITITCAIAGNLDPRLAHTN